MISGGNRWRLYSDERLLITHCHSGTVKLSAPYPGFNLLDARLTRESAWGPETKVYSSGAADEILIDGLPLEERQYDKTLWQDVVKDPDWATYQEPASRSLLRGYSLDMSAADIDAELSSAGIPGNVAPLIQSQGVLGYDEVVDVSVLISESNVDAVRLLRIESFDIPQGPNLPRSLGSDWFLHMGDGGQWKTTAAPWTRALGIWQLNHEGSNALVLTVQNGFFRTFDGGATWQDANYDETEFTSGQYVKTIVVDGEAGTFALIDRGTLSSHGENPLYRLQHRSWVERWRTGFIRMLE